MENSQKIFPVDAERGRRLIVRHQAIRGKSITASHVTYCFEIIRNIRASSENLLFFLSR